MGCCVAVLVAHVVVVVIVVAHVVVVVAAAAMVMCRATASANIRMNLQHGRSSDSLTTLQLRIDGDGSHWDAICASSHCRTEMWRGCFENLDDAEFQLLFSLRLDDDWTAAEVCWNKRW